MPPDFPIAVPISRSHGSLSRALVVGCTLGAFLACGAEIGRMSLDRNKHVVVAGRVYRTAQLKPSQLEAFVQQNGIRTVINLRGRPFSDWYPLETQVTQALGISQEDVTTSANRLPSPTEIRRLVEIFDRSEHPILMHCQQGADRTGLASAMYLLLYTDADYATARRQCSPRYGHFPFLTTVAMDQFLDQYEEWLSERGENHSPANFRLWATADYCPGPGRATLEEISPKGPTEVGRPVVFVVRAYNTSRETWRFAAGSTSAAVKATYVVQRPDGGMLVQDEAGFFDATVPPGGYVDLTLPVPALTVAGKYRLYVDLAQRNVAFTQYGSEPLHYDWEARDPAARGR